MNDDLPLKASVKAGEAISGLQKPAKQMSGLSSTDFLRQLIPIYYWQSLQVKNMPKQRESHEVDKYGERLKTTMSASLGQKETLENSAMIYNAHMDIKYAKDNAQMDMKYAKK